MQRVTMQNTKKPAALEVMINRLRLGAGESDVELSFTALKSVTPKNKAQHERFSSIELSETQSDGREYSVAHIRVYTTIKDDKTYF